MQRSIDIYTFIHYTYALTSAPGTPFSTRTPSAAPHVSSLVTFALPAAHHLRLVITNQHNLLLTLIYSSRPHSVGLVNTWTKFLPKTTSFHQFSRNNRASRSKTR